MSIDLTLGEWIRLGDVILVVLDVEQSRVRFAMEGGDPAMAAAGNQGEQGRPVVPQEAGL